MEDSKEPDSATPTNVATPTASAQKQASAPRTSRKQKQTAKDSSNKPNNPACGASDKSVPELTWQQQLFMSAPSATAVPGPRRSRESPPNSARNSQYTASTAPLSSSAGTTFVSLLTPQIKGGASKDPIVTVAQPSSSNRNKNGASKTAQASVLESPNNVSGNLKSAENGRRRSPKTGRSNHQTQPDGESSSPSSDEGVASGISLMQMAHSIDAPNHLSPTRFRTRRLSVPDASAQATAKKLEQQPPSTPIERHYAGATFQNAPAAHTLPIPVFAGNSSLSPVVARTLDVSNRPRSASGSSGSEHQQIRPISPVHSSPLQFQQSVRSSLSKPPLSSRPSSIGSAALDSAMFDMDSFDSDTVDDALLKKKSKDLLQLLSGASKNITTPSSLPTATPSSSSLIGAGKDSNSRSRRDVVTVEIPPASLVSTRGNNASTRNSRNINNDSPGATRTAPSPTFFVPAPPQVDHLPFASKLSLSPSTTVPSKFNGFTSTQPSQQQSQHQNHHQSVLPSMQNHAALGQMSQNLKSLLKIS
ncbi:hypothetical protein DFJ73DRAFT_757560 [Zopfochytrium polystomum]|nr:hypothetical protein DFJ73DRAFT_757560 [Zopfochytrium polystomum]